MVRVPLLLAALLGLAAGCVVPEEEEANPLFGLCPQWEAGEGQQAGGAVVGNGTPQQAQVLAPATMELHGRAFDMLRLRIDMVDVDASGLRLEAFSTQGQLNWRDFRTTTPGLVPVVVFAQGAAEKDHIFEAYLTPVTQDDAARPGPIELRWTLEGNGTAEVAYTATFHYRVCGAAQTGL